MPLRWPWQRRRPLLLGTIDQLLALARDADDPVKRGEYLDLIRDQSAVLHDAAGDAAMRAVIAMEDRMGDRLREALGPVYDLVGEGVSHARGAETGVVGLQSQVSALEGRFSDLGEALNERLDVHDAELKQLHVGQDQIKTQVGVQIEEIKAQLGDALEKLAESRADRAKLRAEQERQREEQERLRQELRDLQARQAGEA